MEPLGEAAMPDHELSPHRVDGAAATVSRPWLETVTYSVGERVVAVMCGEIDIDTEEAFRLALHKALDRSITGVNLDLSAVGFCDCSGLNVLLHLRRQALAQGKTLALQATGPAVERLLIMTGARCLFTTVHPAGAAPGEARTPHSSVPPRPTARKGAEQSTQDLQTEVEQLRRAMLTRPAIDLARGVLMASFRLSPEDAWSVLVRMSQHTNTKLHQVAEEVLGSVDGHPLSEEMRQQLAAAVENSAGDTTDPSGPLDPTHPTDSHRP